MRYGNFRKAVEIKNRKNKPRRIKAPTRGNRGNFGNLLVDVTYESTMDSDLAE